MVSTLQIFTYHGGVLECHPCENRGNISSALDIFDVFGFTYPNTGKPGVTHRWFSNS